MVQKGIEDLGRLCPGQGIIRTKAVSRIAADIGVVVRGI